MTELALCLSLLSPCLHSFLHLSIIFVVYIDTPTHSFPHSLYPLCFFIHTLSLYPLSRPHSHYIFPFSLRHPRPRLNPLLLLLPDGTFLVNGMYVYVCPVCPLLGLICVLSRHTPSHLFPLISSVIPPSSLSPSLPPFHFFPPVSYLLPSKKSDSFTSCTTSTLPSSPILVLRLGGVRGVPSSFK